MTPRNAGFSIDSHPSASPNRGEVGENFGATRRKAKLAEKSEEALGMVAVALGMGFEGERVTELHIGAFASPPHRLMAKNG